LERGEGQITNKRKEKEMGKNTPAVGLVEVIKVFIFSFSYTERIRCTCSFLTIGQLL
jgi:hypothetical protein